MFCFCVWPSIIGAVLSVTTYHRHVIHEGRLVCRAGAQRTLLVMNWTLVELVRMDDLTLPCAETDRQCGRLGEMARLNTLKNCLSRFSFSTQNGTLVTCSYERGEQILNNLETHFHPGAFAHLGTFSHTRKIRHFRYR